MGNNENLSVSMFHEARKKNLTTEKGHNDETVKR